MPDCTIFSVLSIVTPLVGVALGGIVGFVSARKISDRNARSAAAARLRAALAPALAEIEMHRLHGSTHDQTDVTGFFKSALPVHAAAVEEFRPFVAPNMRHSYQQSWDQYIRSVRDQLVDAWDPGTTGPDEHPWHVVVKNINNVLSHAEP